jgi:hypothetical protein
MDKTICNTKIKHMNNPLVYLAGAIENAPNYGKEWRENISHFLINELHHEVFNPCHEENHVLTPYEFRNFRKWKTTDLKRFRPVVHKIIHKDLSTIIEHVNYIICYWDNFVEKGGGTQGELTVAFINKIPVYMVSNKPIEQISSWIIGCTNEIFFEFESLKEFLIKKYKSQKE